MTLTDRESPYAIAMWDFSWLERHREGDAYADWDQVLDELTARGYDAVRIDAYPHLVSMDPFGGWTIPPAFETAAWGAPTTCQVTVIPALLEFIEKCAERNVAVALSSWFRADTTNARMDIQQPADLASVWIDTLDRIADAGLLETIAWVDLCNEFPLPDWAPFFNRPGDPHVTHRRSSAARRWIDKSTAAVRELYPNQIYCVSETAGPGKPWGRAPESEMDLVDTHLWLMNTSDFFDWSHDIDSAEHYDWLADDGQERYVEYAERWQARLRSEIESAAMWSRNAGVPLATTESWAVIHYDDRAELEWDWIKELCAIGTKHAAKTGRWVALSTSNFCGPQFRGMWDDVRWHRELTSVIRNAPVDT
jgi:hypothetical protein